MAGSSWLSQGGVTRAVSAVAGLFTGDSVPDWVVDEFCAIAEMLAAEIGFMISVQVKSFAINDWSSRKIRAESRRYYFSQLAHLTA